MLESKFTQHLYQLSDEAIHSYFSVFLMKHNKITADIANVDKVLDLKTST
jgi:hypothetical protein